MKGPVVYSCNLKLNWNNAMFKVLGLARGNKKFLNFNSPW